MERDYPELLNFTDEILHLDSASKVSVESIQKSLTQMDKSIRNLEMDLKNAARGPIEDNDRYSKAYSLHCIYENILQKNVKACSFPILYSISDFLKPWVHLVLRPEHNATYSKKCSKRWKHYTTAWRVITFLINKSILWKNSCPISKSLKINSRYLFYFFLTWVIFFDEYVCLQNSHFNKYQLCFNSRMHIQK